MTLAADLQPDQQPACWDDHVDVYERVFEPLSNAFAARALDLVGVRAGDRLIDVAAGAGGAALLAAGRGADVVAIDASPAMVARIRGRAAQSTAGGRVHAEVMDGMALALPTASFDAAISVFGVILFPDAPRGVREIARVLRPGGRMAVVTWTQTERYELAARLMGAVASVRGPQPSPSALPAQLRFRDEGVFRDLLEAAGLKVEAVTAIEQCWRLPSARWISDHIAFAPGMAAMLGALGTDRAVVLDAFTGALERDQGRGEVALTAVAQVAVAVKRGSA